MKTCFFVIALLSSLVSPTAAKAELFDLLPNRFLDRSTNLVWIDTDQFRGMSFNQVVATLSDSPFRLATKAEVQAMVASAGRTINAAGTPLVPSLGFRSLSGWYDDSATGTDPTKAGRAAVDLLFENVRSFDDDFASNDTSDEFGGAWVVGTYPFDPPDNPFMQDFDGDGVEEKVIFRPSSGDWFFRFSSLNQYASVQLGLPGDRPLTGDFDGDHIPDIAVYRPASGFWFVMESSSEAIRYTGARQQQFGLPGDIPVRADYDGDNHLDFAVWRPSTGTFYYLRSSDSQVIAQQFGLPGDIPVEAAVDPTPTPTPRRQR